MPPSDSEHPSDCSLCTTRLEGLSERVLKVESTVLRLDRDYNNSSRKFDSHMVKEEQMWDKFFEKLRSTESHISEIVMRGMEDMMSLKELLRDEAETAQKEMRLEISIIKRDFVSKQTAIIAFTVGAVVAGIVTFLFSTFTVDRVQAKQTAQIQEMTQQLTKEIRGKP